MSQFPHVEWMDLENTGILTEIAVMKRDTNGNIYFIRLDALDNIDKQRIAKIITNRNAPMYELWDLMSNITLGNGINALTYFHQLVKVRTPNGKVMKPRVGQMGARVRRAAVQETIEETIEDTVADVGESAPVVTKRSTKKG